MTRIHPFKIFIREGLTDYKNFEPSKKGFISAKRRGYKSW